MYIKEVIVECYCKYVSATEVGDYYEVMFKKEIYKDEEYIMIQRQFEFLNDECYIESNDLNYCGDFKINKAVLYNNRVEIEIDRKSNKEITVKYPLTLENHSEVRRILKIIIPDLIIK